MKLRFTDSFILLLVFCWFNQLRLGKRLKSSGMEKEALFSGVSSYFCLAIAAAAYFLRAV